MKKGTKIVLIISVALILIGVIVAICLINFTDLFKEKPKATSTGKIDDWEFVGSNIDTESYKR